MELKKTTAVITGSTGKLGKAIALTLAHAGCDCICHYNMNKDAAARLVAQIQNSGRKAIAVKADFSDPDQARQLFNLPDDFQTVRVLVNSAAVFSRDAVADLTAENVTGLLNVNLTAPLIASRYFVEMLNAIDTPKTNPVGKIINIVDIGAIKPWAGYSAYCASKAGLLAATKSMAKEFAPQVCVNAVAPGVITFPDEFNEHDKQRQIDFIPAGRIGTQNEIVSTITFLLQNDYVTGQVINVDGGRCI